MYIPPSPPQLTGRPASPATAHQARPERFRWASSEGRAGRKGSSKMCRLQGTVFKEGI